MRQREDNVITHPVRPGLRFIFGFLFSTFSHKAPSGALKRMRQAPSLACILRTSFARLFYRLAKVG